MYELILSVMVNFAGPVASIDGHGVDVITQRYEVALQGFASEGDCANFAGFTDLEKALTDTFGGTTKVISEAAPRCQKQPSTVSAKQTLLSR
ncbi:MAG TPA: hypothetical protein VK696_07025 [Steroidobacteraceae bacterium]|jgi:hypothetical protein|nr:hypothetical protein [Steroidobacteraceae bacterium]